MPKLPLFKPNDEAQRWVKNERTTAKVIQILWRHGTNKDHSDPNFFKVLIRCSWVNSNEGSDEALRKRRNLDLASWLGLDANATDELLAASLHQRRGISSKDANWLVATSSGITHYYTAFRTEFFQQVDAQAQRLGKAFRLVTQTQDDVERKIEQVAKLVVGMTPFNTPNGGTTSMMNGLAPVLACLDPQQRFPIVNAKTVHLLKAIEMDADVAGVLTLSRLIGQFGIKDSFELDVYASTLKELPTQRKRRSTIKVPDPRTVGFKSEEMSVAQYTKRKAVIRKQHNELINAFKRSVDWNHELCESEYDILIENWQPGRWLLIEAKSEIEGVLGRSQLRQAIGQLFDYRWRSFRKQLDKVDLALLTPTKPGKDILDLLKALGIQSLWFEGKTLSGTISLHGQ